MSQQAGVEDSRQILLLQQREKQRGSEYHPIPLIAPIWQHLHVLSKIFRPLNIPTIPWTTKNMKACDPKVKAPPQTSRKPQPNVCILRNIKLTINQQIKPNYLLGITYLPGTFRLRWTAYTHYPFHFLIHNCTEILQSKSILIWPNPQPAFAGIGPSALPQPLPRWQLGIHAPGCVEPQQTTLSETVKYEPATSYELVPGDTCWWRICAGWSQ